MRLLCKRDYTFSRTPIIAQNLGWQTYTLSFRSCAYRSLSETLPLMQCDLSLSSEHAVGWKQWTRFNALHSTCAPSVTLLCLRRKDGYKEEKEWWKEDDMEKQRNEAEEEWYYEEEEEEGEWDKRRDSVNKNSMNSWTISLASRIQGP